MTKFVSDAAHSEVGFQVKHMMVSKVKGYFESFTFEVDTDKIETFENAEVYAEIDVDSVSTKNADRDAHLKSEDFFNVEKNPKIIFKSRNVTKNGDTVTIDGDATINGVTKEMSIDLQYNGKGTNPWGQEVHGFEGEFTINREDFGLTWNQTLETGGVLVSKDVKAMLELQFSEKSE
ncbi:YceI family protein [Salinicoccus sesuvii]|uniref:YceI family protein n=1 Tax=Salinicoccus sesuvii TaxID=868281 RepID=A0ABV7N6F0_9STAP